MVRDKTILSISVIIPVFNEEKYIKKCLDSIKGQTVAPKEIILVDSRSGDRTREIAVPYADRIIETEKGSIGRSRNIGAGVSCGDIFLFVDADMLLGKDFIEKTIEFFKYNRDTGAVSGVFRPIQEENSFIHRFIVDILINGVAKFSLLIKKPHITGGAFAFRREVFRKAGGFDESLQTAEDTEIFRKISRSIPVAVCDELNAEMSMRRFRDLDWLYDWVLGSIYYEATGKSLVADYKTKR
jgi:glycosyltransferase involved in cell wall biosynthesis